MGGPHHGTIDIRNRMNSRNSIQRGQSIQTSKTEDIDNKFTEYSENISLTENQIEKIKERREIVENSLSKEISIKEKHIIGSYARETMINKVDGNDVDIMIVLDKEKHGDWMNQEKGPGNCLQKIKDILQNDPRYKNCEIHIDRNAVTIRYKDFKIDVVPAFKDTEGYRIPDTGGGQKWIHTNPRLFKRVMEISNNSNNGRVKEVVKIVKGWNEKNGKPLKSFHIETMVYTYFKESAPKDEKRTISDDVKDFYSRLRWYLRVPSNEPIYNERVDGYLNSENRAKVIKRANDAYGKIKGAHEDEFKGNIEKAKSKYKRVFGDKW